MARSVFSALRGFDAYLVTSIMPRTVVKPDAFEAAEYLRKDHVFLLERYFYFLERERARGLLVFDAVDGGLGLSGQGMNECTRPEIAAEFC